MTERPTIMAAMRLIVVGLALAACTDERSGQPASTTTAADRPSTAAAVTDQAATSTVTSATQPLRYRAVGSVIQAAPAPAMLAFSRLDSLPPEAGFGIPLASWSWDAVSGEQTLRNVTWTDGPFEFIGEWDGVAFTPTESPRAVAWQRSEETFLTPNCDPTPWLTMLEQLDADALGIVSGSDDLWDGRCGVEIRVLIDTPAVRQAIEPFGDRITVTYELTPID